MAGRLITPPDIISSEHSILILDPSEIELTSVILWLKTVQYNYDIHLYYSNTKDVKWLTNVLQFTKTVLSSRLRSNLSEDTVKNIKTIEYGPDTEYQDLLQYFLKKHVSDDK
jgi:hypothetical protein